MTMTRIVVQRYNYFYIVIEKKTISKLNLCIVKMPTTNDCAAVRIIQYRKGILYKTS